MVVRARWAASHPEFAAATPAFPAFLVQTEREASEVPAAGESEEASISQEDVAAGRERVLQKMRAALAPRGPQEAPINSDHLVAAFVVRRGSMFRNGEVFVIAETSGSMPPGEQRIAYLIEACRAWSLSTQAGALSGVGLNVVIAHGGEFADYQAFGHVDQLSLRRGVCQSLTLINHVDGHVVQDRSWSLVILPASGRALDYVDVYTPFGEAAARPARERPARIYRPDRQVGLAAVLMLLIAAATFWLPVVGPFLAGFVGGRKGGGMAYVIAGVSMIAVPLLGLLLSIIILASRDPDNRWEAEIRRSVGLGVVVGGVVVAALYMLPLAVGAFVGGSTKNVRAYAEAQWARTATGGVPIQAPGPGSATTRPGGQPISQAAGGQQG